jgi:hypothetical protein
MLGHRTCSAPDGRLQPRKLLKGRIMVMCSVMLIALAWGIQISLTSASSPSVRIDVPSDVILGEPFQIAIWLQDASQVAGYELMILYDTDAATFRGVAHRDTASGLLGRYFRTIGPDEIQGGIAIGAYSCSSATCEDSSDPPEYRTGDSGLFQLSLITIVPDTLGTLVVEIGAPIFVDVEGRPLTMSLDQMTFTINVAEN